MFAIRFPLILKEVEHIVVVGEVMIIVVVVVAVRMFMVIDGSNDCDNGRCCSYWMTVLVVKS